MATNHPFRHRNPLDIFNAPFLTLAEAAEELNIDKVKARRLLDWNTEDDGPSPSSEFPNSYKSTPGGLTSKIRIPVGDIVNYKLRAALGCDFEGLRDRGLLAMPGETEDQVMSRVEHER